MNSVKYYSFKNASHDIQYDIISFNYDYSINIIYINDIIEIIQKNTNKYFVIIISFVYT